MNSFLYDSDEEYFSEEEIEGELETNSKSFIKEDCESVIIQSKNDDHTSNKKIQSIRENLNLILGNHFLHHEIIEINSMYNFNPDCLKNRSKFLQELIPVNLFLESKQIKIIKDLYPLVYKKIPNIFKKKINSNIERKMRKQFVFQDNKQINDEIHNETFLEIKKYCAGIVFVIKNQIILHTENNSNTLSLLIKNPNSVFIDDCILQYIIDWFLTLVLNILLFQLKNKILDGNLFIFKNRNNIEYYVSCCFKIIFSLILEIDEKVNNNTLIFLFIHDKKDIMKNLVKDKLFTGVIKLLNNSLSKIETQKMNIKYLLQTFEKNLKKNLID